MPTPRKYNSQAARQAAYRARLSAAEKEGLPAIPTVPGYPRWQSMIRASLTMLANVHQEMDDYYQARSEAWQESERGEAFLERMDALTEILDLLDSLDTSKAKEKTTS